MNEHDSERMAYLLESMGYQATEDTNEADFIAMNTCLVRENAEQKVFGHLTQFIGVGRVFSSDDDHKIHLSRQFCTRFLALLCCATDRFLYRYLYLFRYGRDHILKIILAVCGLWNHK